LADTAAIFAEHRDGIFRYLTRIVGHADVAGDLTQEVFLRVTRAGSPPAEVAERRAWIFTIARNLALNHQRDRSRLPPMADVVDVPRAATQEVVVSVRSALAALPDLDRQVFLLREAGGLSYDEIAAVEKISPDAVRSRLHRARQQLREHLGAPLDAQRRRGIRLERRD
jgi:RNA polymerase sigma-70 factor (ECF subfamily)